MNKIFYLKTCDTCKKIIKQINTIEDFELKNIKDTIISEAELDSLYQHTKSYESLFNKRAQLYKKLDFKNKNLSECDYKKYILEEYTFLKRPVIVYNEHVFVGNSKKTIEEMLNIVNK